MMIAFDLAANENRNTGYAYFSRGKIVTGLVHTDNEILKLAEKYGRDGIAIDAPLSLPKGRKSIEDRNGNHFRKCDLLLRKLGIPFFPITIGGMRKLTKRGMRIAEELREIGFEVYEIFPGASLDLLGLERKNVKVVREFLQPFNCNPSCVDESDAAIGLFTLYLYKNKFGFSVSGEDGKIILPNPAIYLGKLTKGKFIRRENKFLLLAEINGRKERVYVRHTGRMEEYLFEGNDIYVVKKKGKIRWLLRAVNYKGEKVMADPFLDVKMARLWLRRKGIKATTKNVKRNSTFDLSWNNCIAEVKGVDFRFGNSGVFPDTYSERAERHFRELAEMKGCRWIIFVSHFSCKEIILNPSFPSIQNAFREALENGVRLLGISTKMLAEYWVGEEKVEVKG